jgi:hypothetical protein
VSSLFSGEVIYDNGPAWSGGAEAILSPKLDECITLWGDFMRPEKLPSPLAQN